MEHGQQVVGGGGVGRDVKCCAGTGTVVGDERGYNWHSQ